MAVKLDTAFKTSVAGGRLHPVHSHNIWELMYYREGWVDVFMNETTYAMGPGSVILTPPNKLHSEIGRTDYSLYILLLEVSPNPDWNPVCLDDSQQTLVHLFRMLVDEFAGGAEGCREMIDAALVQLAIAIGRMQVQRTELERIVTQAKRLIEEGYCSQIRVADVAKDVGVCPTTLRNYFHHECGISPIDYLQEVRFSHAAALLRNSTLKLETIADICGYTSASHLSHAVKSLTGERPGALREVSS